MSLLSGDVIAIQALVAKYNVAVDEGDPDGFASCFTEEGEFSWAENEYHGRDELVGLAKALGGDGQMRHIVTSMLTDGDRKRAAVRSYCHVTSVGDDGMPFVTVQGIYEDDLTHTDGRWLFTKRRFISDKLPLDAAGAARQGASFCGQAWVACTSSSGYFRDEGRRPDHVEVSCR